MGCRSVLERLLAPIAGEAAATIAQRLLSEIGNLSEILHADPAILQLVTARADIANHLATVRDTLTLALQPARASVHVLKQWSAVEVYLQFVMARHRIEQVRVLFLNSRNILLRDEVMSQGDVEQSAIYVREIMKRSIDIGACAIILVHNHPSGDPSPSEADLRITRTIAATGKTLGVRLLDHVIVARDGIVSLRSLGYL